MTNSDDAFERWLAAAEKRYLADLTRREVGRALRALSSCYVERRDKLATGHALEGRGKRAAFALYYGPLHFLTVREIARNLAGLKPRRHTAHSDLSAGLKPRRHTEHTDVEAELHLRDVEAGLQPREAGDVGAGLQPREIVVDVGCGTGAAGAAWALETGAEVRGFDVSAWAVDEANWTYQTLGVRGRARRGTVGEMRLPPEPSTILAAFVINELDAKTRDVALERLLAAVKAGHQVLVIEPIARGVTPWWESWRAAFSQGRVQTRDWRFRIDLPPLLRDFDKAAGLDHLELTARSLVATR